MDKVNDTLYTVQPNGYWRKYAIHDEERIFGFFGQYRWLSNFHLSPVMCEEEVYPSVEHAFQALKYPTSQRERFRDENMTPLDAKIAGAKRGIPGFDPIKWDVSRRFIMSYLTFDKFNRNKELRDKLLGTEDRLLEESNHWGDNYWGSSYAEHEGEWISENGRNELGKILMDVRHALSCVI